ncbi:5'-3'-deoxyribonucleotidase [Heyndrickxia shackletonii]|uniref:5'-3'-deoxyribonucleotidase n=1 Tax=Heyndrickxia shackletonii TaxID=157838 RepID=A0A0Q3WV94_9BACI|nr:5'-3'-deoxyribonucleotidase [Heyndrickxia shackletonii]KQL52243.1 5'-3'-deoxyribonucleotidase [Heyndrickxia shackletonii]MBB2480823.1 5'-3'-deoxyribonucleotidase [Bacillus sp. APMAM]NEZ00262.1 5'-3'-deoxyribonucleotidase [Heyndrickxia shackletonii]RTZ55807.1 5'-3'-deoxyribonucleotidase [Bacillus sp. SAJ1]
MKRIAIDMDEVMADFIPKQLKIYNRDYNENLTIDDLKGKKLRELRPHIKEELRKYFLDPTFFRDLEVMKDSQEVIKELSKSYEIFITTAAMEVPASFTAKYEWLKEHFGFLNDMNFVFCGDKSIIHADYLIDDNARHFNRFMGQGILFTAPHNINVTGYVRVNNWQDVRKYFLG